MERRIVRQRLDTNMDLTQREPAPVQVTQVRAPVPPECALDDPLLLCEEGDEG